MQLDFQLIGAAAALFFATSCHLLTFWMLERNTRKILTKQLQAIRDELDKEI